MSEPAPPSPRPLVRPPLAKGRGALSNAGSRYEPEDRTEVDDGWGGLEAQTPAPTTVQPLASRTIITRNASPDLSFDRTINPYKGCEHGCIYCYARPKHAYLGLSPGLDFERKLFSKPNAAALLKEALSKRGYRARPIILGADTDPYQPIERTHKITRSILEVLCETRHPVGIVTKSDLVLRDLDLLAEMATRGVVKVAISITTLDAKLARAMEPRAVRPDKRLEAIEALSAAGVPVRIMTAPVIPGLTDHELETVLCEAHERGAVEAGYVLLRLPLEIKDLFREWLEAERPGAAKKVVALMRSTRGGGLYQSDFGVRQKGTGAFAELIAARFARAVRRLGLNVTPMALRQDAFRPPRADGQRDLFD